VEGNYETFIHIITNFERNRFGGNVGQSANNHRLPGAQGAREGAARAGDGPPPAPKCTPPISAKQQEEVLTPDPKAQHKYSSHRRPIATPSPPHRHPIFSLLRLCFYALARSFSCSSNLSSNSCYRTVCCSLCL
jgi:hypothetical protein